MSKNFLKGALKKLIHKNTIIALASILILLVIEFQFDLIEMVVGQLLDWSNPIRPKMGTLWSLEKKDQSALSQLQTIPAVIPQEPREVLNELETVDELRAVLDTRGQVVISQRQFLKLYTQMPHSLAQEIVSPFDLLTIAHSGRWRWTKIIKGESEISGEELRIYFLDDENQLIMDSYPPLSIFYLPSESGPVSLEELSEFKDRIITADQFYAAFNSLSVSLKVQIINNPFQLLRWGDNLKRVGISRYLRDSSISIGFEVSDGIFTELHRYQASELAATYLIARLNELFPQNKIIMPERIESESSIP
ncbi:MAG: hypothetical protein ONB05_02545 [candidate division KSB1 bacterium]|nr:hypothetical protein [candidate division KSB1 bacterium]